VFLIGFAHGLKRQKNNRIHKHKDQEELQDLLRKLDNVVDGFTVRASSLTNRTSKLLMHTQRSSVFRSEMKSLQNGSDVNAMRDLARRMVQLQVQREAKRVAELDAGEITTFLLAACVD
jgi:hypothetical protein